MGADGFNAAQSESQPVVSYKCVSYVWVFTVRSMEGKRILEGYSDRLNL